MSVLVPAAPEATPSRAGGLVSAIARAEFGLASRLDAEQGRWFLWIPVFFGGGVGLYFAFSYEPPLTLAFGVFLACLSARMLARTQLFAFLLTSILLCMSAGFLAAKVRTAVMAAPVIERHGAYDFEGFVESFDRQTAKRARAVIRLLSMKLETAEITERPFRFASA